MTNYQLMLLIRDNIPLAQALDQFRAQKKRIAFVPTMGALHAGHLSLVERAKEQADVVVASIFVNPTQFGANEDLSRYPRQEKQDAALLEAAGVSIAWFPKVEDIYPSGALAILQAPAELANVLCGVHRPGHFDGVATVVMRLFDLVQPDSAFFGEKDWQQLAIIRAVTSRHHPEIQVYGAPILREADGLAMSSRNTYLSAAERALAPALYRTLQKTAHAIRTGSTPPIALADGINALEQNGFAVDYFEFRDNSTLQHALTPPARLFIAARLGATRLIDNLGVE